MAVFFRTIGQLLLILSVGVLLNTLIGRTDRWFNALSFLPKEFQLIGSIVLIVASLLLVIVTNSIVKKQKK
ncbi:hypothetical protein EPA93_03540 [Ktedonosporobacter rubrisoli]|uniref:Uncharacterized protein n=1 Tax=Ktedonosporobacter rubrisoli TaxID=2509675 RepID=A0A4P6JJ35_KTERU|nr:hypothetical protein [Ktedonosporobacter rubrisoli]QBD75117.1 hypothetical protein EPA93_03540 [Ktedonosporobacter rubrisoli]